MATEEIKQYYNATKSSKIRLELIESIELVNEPKIAIDCGCGAGSDIEYLLSKDFYVYGFDIEKEAIDRCKIRFKNNSKVILCQDTFSSFNYPKASLVVADASLFFCPKSEFEFVWSQINKSLSSKGVFCGSFLGPEDTMASNNFDKNNYWSDILVFTKQEVERLFNNYKIYKFNEHKSSGTTPDGKAHNWHIFSVVAKKI